MTDVESTDWSPTDASNTQAVPNGAPNNFARTETKNIFRMAMGAVKRLRNRMTPTVTSSGTAPAFVLSYTGAPSPVQGSQFAFKAGSALTGGGMTLDPGSGSAKKVYDITGTTQLTTGAFIAGTRIVVAYDTALDSLAGGFVWLNQGLPSTLNAATATSLSGTSVTITVPSNVREVVIMLNGASLSGATELAVQIGDSGGIEASGYLGATVFTANGNSTSAANPTGSFRTLSANASAAFFGAIRLTRMTDDGMTWACVASLFRSDVGSVDQFGGVKTLSAALDRVSIGSADGSSTFDAGTYNAMFIR